MFLDHLVRKRKNCHANPRYWIMTLDELNHLGKNAAEDLFSQCCSASRWAATMVKQRPYQSLADLQQTAEIAWQGMQRPDFIAAFEGHPKIGDPASLKEKYRSTLATASHEQSGVNVAPEHVLDDLAQLNRRYEKRFGYIFIVCATGKSAAEMLEIIKARINNTAHSELEIAAAEQAKITAIRISSMLDHNQQTEP